MFLSSPVTPKPERTHGNGKNVPPLEQCAEIRVERCELAMGICRLTGFVLVGTDGLTIVIQPFLKKKPVRP